LGIGTKHHFLLKTPIFVKTTLGGNILTVKGALLLSAAKSNTKCVLADAVKKTHCRLVKHENKLDPIDHIEF